MTLHELVTTWRARAASLETFAADGPARATLICAEELEQALRTEALTIVSLQDAAALSGYSTDHLARLIKTGALENAGRKHAPRIRVADLPRKPGASTPAGAPDPTDPSLGGITRAAVAGQIPRRRA